MNVHDTLEQRWILTPPYPPFSKAMFALIVGNLNFLARVGEQQGLEP
jgi:hypothetical protein